MILKVYLLPNVLGRRTHLFRGSDVFIRKFSSNNASGTALNKAKKIKSPSKLPENFKKFMNYAYPARKTLLFGIICLPGALVSMMSVPIVVGKVIDLVSSSLGSNSGMTDEVFNQAKSLGITLIALSLFGSAATFGRSYFMNLTTETIVKHLRLNLFKDLVKNKKAEFFDTSKTGDLVNRLSSDTTIIAHFLSESVSMGLRGLGTLTFGFGFLVYTSPVLASVSVCSLAPLVIFGRLFGTKMKKETNDQLNAFGESSALAEESLSFVKTIQIFNREDLQSSKYEDQLQEVYILGAKLCLTRAKFFAVTQFIMDTTMISLIATGSYLVFSNELTPGELTSFLMYALYVAGANFQLSSVYSAAMKALGAVQRIEEVGAEKVLQRTDLVKPFNNTPQSFSVQFKDVEFSYPTRQNDMILNQLNLTIPSGKVVAVVGHSGCGKSTLFSLLTSLYTPTKGSISLIEEQSNSKYDLKEVDVTNLRDNVGVVTQEPVILMSSIFENIRFGNLSATKEQVIEACKLANIHDFIETLPEKYDSIVGQRGSQLSGGQKQRLCIARAIVKDPKLLLLDEATSSLDVQSEALVQSALETLMTNKTTIIIAHRLSTIKNADFIAVIDQGKVVQFGPLQEVMNNSGAFQEFLKTERLP